MVIVIVREQRLKDTAFEAVVSVLFVESTKKTRDHDSINYNTFQRMIGLHTRVRKVVRPTR